MEASLSSRWSLSWNSQLIKAENVSMEISAPNGKKRSPQGAPGHSVHLKFPQGMQSSKQPSREVEVNILPSRYPCCYEVFLGKIITKIRRCWWKAYLGRAHSKDQGPWEKREVTKEGEDCHQTDLGLRPPAAPLSWASTCHTDSHLDSHKDRMSQLLK